MHLRLALYALVLFARLDSVVGANRCAATAFDAGIGIDVVDFALGDSFNGADGKAGAASYAAVGNYISHSKYSLECYK